eukprot:g8346.t1
MKLAVIGSGISGLVCADRLCHEHDVTLFEAGSYLGGHTNTIDVEIAGERHAIDTGFIVFNEWTYPNFIALLDDLGIASRPTAMSFSVNCPRTKLEYNGTSLNGLFAQRRNLLRPAFYRMLADILRFNREALSVLDSQTDESQTVGEFLAARSYSPQFVRNYLLPMGSAIWSCPPTTFEQFPIRFIAEFYRNHGLLNIVNRPTWRVVEGGSRTYVEAIRDRFLGTIRRSGRNAGTQTSFARIAHHSAERTGVTVFMKTGSTAHLPSVARSNARRFAFRPQPNSRERRMHSCLYEGRVAHRRFEPVEHAFDYSLFLLYLDLSELDNVFRRRWFWSTRRPALARFRRDDHLGDPEVPLDVAVRDLVESETGDRPQGPVRLLTHLRYFGYIMNPVSFYYCFDAADGEVKAVVAEVTNTPWNERHCYVLPTPIDRPFATTKEFHVSPFMGMEMEYHWRLSAPGEQLSVQMENHEENRRLFSAALSMRRRPLTASHLARVLLRHPLMTFKVAAGIYWQALRLKLKRGGAIRLPDGDDLFAAGDSTADLQSTLTVHHPRFYRRAVFGGSLGAAESYLDGDWSCDDLTALIRIFGRNLQLSDELDRGLPRIGKAIARIAHRFRANTRNGSRKNIQQHYDLSNDFFELFLDESMMYSCAYFEDAGVSLEAASTEKLERICRKLELSPRDHVVEIGTGWGGFAEYAAKNFGCRVTTTTISREQHEYARRRIAAAGLNDRVELLLEDYRDLTGRYDKLVSIEMIEAVGHEFLGTFFQKCGRLLHDDGLMLIQGITMSEQRYPQYLKSVDFIQRYIFPGGCLTTPKAMAEAAAGETDLRVTRMDDLSSHYAETLRRWRDRFFDRLDDVKALGFPERFVRMWNYYLCYCEAAFDERLTGLAQMVFAKPGYRGDAVPAGFYTSALGRRLKYSCCYWPEGVDTLDAAEDAALETTCQRAGIADGMHILDLGCGWGSASLWIAEHFPNCQITAVSNSASQRAFIERQAAERGFENVNVSTADMNDFQTDQQFDRVISIEMFEHMRNHSELLRRISNWLKPEGKLFVHIFCHRLFTYPFLAVDDSDWMAKHFFTGGIMPGDDLLVRYQEDLKLARQWRWSGTHYQKTSESWLRNLDANADRVRQLFNETYGEGDAERWIHRWRLFFLACAELFGFNDGHEWWVSHYLFEKPAA